MKAEYGLDDLPAAWEPLTWDVQGNSLTEAGKLYWSGKDEPPPVAARVEVLINGMGPGRVVGYFVEGPYLGVEVRLEKNPGWRLKQHGGKDLPVLAFGKEIRPA